MRTNTLNYQIHKRSMIRISQENYNMSPVLSEYPDVGSGGVDGKFVAFVRCNKCGKQYSWNQHVRQMRHYHKCKETNQ